jgi:demethylmenaquinone methyltransferase / 2-methoxy-6-polyprenyl-1,4-benzoquinol methylase
MAQFDPKAHSKYVRDMFSRIAPRYDLMNRLMTGGQDIRWRREVIHRAGLRTEALLLDIGTGTGDLAREAARQFPHAKVFPADFALRMMQVGQQRGVFQNCSVSDALMLPFPDHSFDAVVSGFLVRNVSNIEETLREQFRVLKNGGRVVVLDTTPPKRNLLFPIIWIHMHAIIPLLGGLVSGMPDAYRYLPDTTEHFLNAEALSALMSAAGFYNVAFRRHMFGTIAIHWGVKAGVHRAENHE